jgi:hypothetical protein
MTKLYYILVLFFISTGYLFSQTEEYGMIKADTVERADDTSAEFIPEIEKTGVISAKAGVGLLFGALSASWDIPIIANQNISVGFCTGAGGDFGGGDYNFSIIGLGLGVVSKKSDNFIFKASTRPCYLFLKKNFGKFLFRYNR